MTPPDSTAEVKRHYLDGNDPSTLAGCTVVLASDHDAAIAERDARIAELERFRSVDAGVEVLLRHRIAELEQGLRIIAAFGPIPSADAWTIVRSTARALLATTHNQE